MQSLIDDVSILTTIPSANLLQLIDKAIFCICDDVEETKLKGEKLTEIDTGIGILSIFVDNNTIQYKFVPNKRLENSVKSTVINNKNPLVSTVEKTLTQRILNTYKQYL